MVVDKEDHDGTRERLLTQAEILFAAGGYNGVSVRQITTAADCNLAAVNYHFGNKKNLYLAVFRERWLIRAGRLRECFEADLAGAKESSVEEIFGALANAFLRGPLTDTERIYHVQLIQREMVNPSEAFQLVADEVMGPFMQDIARRLRLHVIHTMDEEQIMLHVFSIFSMVLYFNFARAAVTHITGHLYDESLKKRLVEHIAAFSARGFGAGRKREAG